MSGIIDDKPSETGAQGRLHRSSRTLQSRQVPLFQKTADKTMYKPKKNLLEPFLSLILCTCARISSQNSQRDSLLSLQTSNMSCFFKD